MEQVSGQMQWSITTLMALLVTAVAVLAGANIWLLVSARRTERQLATFFKEIDEQVSAFLATHRTWSDVSHKAIEAVPTFLEGSVRLISGAMELAEMVNRYGGASALIDKVRNGSKTAAKKQTATKSQTDVTGE